MANNNVQNVRFLRNGSLYVTRDAALSGLNGQTLAAEQDGSIILARYGSGDEVKTLVGLVYVNGGNKSLTIFDIEGASGDVEALREEINAKLGNGIGSGASETVTAQLAALRGNAQSTSAETSVEGAKRYADQILSDTISALDYSGITTSNAAVVTNVTEADGKVAATSANVGNLKLTDYTKGSDSGSVAATDSINAAVAKLENQIDAANANVDAKIEALDGTITAETGYYINKVDEVDGKISGTTAALPTVAAISEAGKPITAVSESLGAISASAGTINAEYVNVADSGNKFTASTVEAVLAEIDTAYKAADASIVGDATTSGDTLGKLEDRIEALDADAKEYHIVKTTTGLPADIKERYSLVDADDNVSGATIDIPKDSHIVSIPYITNSGDTHYQNLEYKYIDASGATKTEYVDISSLVLEAEFASGVTVTDHVAHGVVDPTSETFLTVGAGGFKLSGVQNAINSAINGLDVTGDTAVAGQYVAAIEETDGVVAVKTRANVSEAVLNNYAKGSDATAVANTDTVNQAISKLENQIDAAEEAAKAAATVIASGSSADTTEHLEIVTTTDSTTSAKTYTFNLKNIASQTDLNTLSGKTFTVATSSNASITTAVTAAADGTKSVDLITDASKIKMSGFTSTDVLSGITSSSSITEAFKEVDKVITDNEEVVSAALNDLNERIDELSGGTAGDLAAEIAARKAVDGQTGQTYAANTNANYISNATSLNDADVKLDAALKSLSDATVNEVQVNGVALAETSNAVNVKISAAAGTGAASTPITVDTNSSTGAVTLKLEGLDCGTY